MVFFRIDKDGWLEGDAPVHRYTIKPRPGKDGKLFCPLSLGLHPFIAQKYGDVRGCVIHCTDVICDAGALARRTAESSPRQSSYNLLIGTTGDLHQLASVRDRTWHAGRGPIGPQSAYYGKGETARTRWAHEPAPFGGRQLIMVAAGNQWRWPVVDGRVVQNPNNFGPGIEEMGKPGRPTSAQLETLAGVLRALYAGTKITPDTVWAHGDLDPLHRSDPGWPELYEFAEAISQRQIDAREEKEGTGPGGHEEE